MATGPDPDDLDPDGFDPDGFDPDGVAAGDAADDDTADHADIRRTHHRDGGDTAAIVITIHDDTEFVTPTVDALRPYGDVIVVDDASTDDGADRAARAGAVVIRHGRRLGPDRALATGLARALELGATTIITTSVTLEHDPAALAELLTARDVSGADLVLAVRRHPHGLSHRSFALWTRFRFGMTDPLCPLRAFDAELVRRLLPEARKASLGTALVFAALRDGANFAVIDIAPRVGTPAPGFTAGLATEGRVAAAFGAALVDDAAWTVRTTLTRR